MAGGKPEPQSTGVKNLNQKRTYPEPEPTTGGYSWNQKGTYPEPEPTIKQQMYPVNQNTPTWVNTIIGFMNALRTELLTKINQCCPKSYGKNNILTMRKFRENIGTPEKTKMSYGEDYSDDGDYDESGPQPYKQITPKVYLNEHKKHKSSYNSPSLYHSTHGTASSFDSPSIYGKTSSYKKPSIHGHASTYKKTKSYHKPQSYHNKSPKPYMSTSSSINPSSSHKATYSTYHKAQHHPESPHVYENDSPSYYGKVRNSPRPYDQVAYSHQSYGQGPSSYQVRPKTYWDMEGPGPHNPQNYGLSSYDTALNSNHLQKKRTHGYQQLGSSYQAYYGNGPSSYQSGWKNTGPSAYNTRLIARNSGPNAYYAGPRSYDAGLNAYNAEPKVYDAGPSAYNAEHRAYNAGPRAYNAGSRPYNAEPSSYNAEPRPYNAGPSPYNSGPRPYNAGPSPYNARPSPHNAEPSPYNAGPSAYHEAHAEKGKKEEVPVESEVANPLFSYEYLSHQMIQF